MQYRYISDLHLYHNYSIDWRPQFKDLDAFAENLIATWNATVANDDIVFIVGDVGAYTDRTKEVLQSLKGTKILIVGNHDAYWCQRQYSGNLFQGIHNSFDLGSIHIEHIPDEEVIHNSYYIHGHHHIYDTPGMYKALKKYQCDTYRLNCCTDLVGHKPVTLQELILSKELLLDKLSDLLTSE